MGRRRHRDNRHAPREPSGKVQRQPRERDRGTHELIVRKGVIVRDQSLSSECPLSVLLGHKLLDPDDQAHAQAMHDAGLAFARVYHATVGKPWAGIVNYLGIRPRERSGASLLRARRAYDQARDALERVHAYAIVRDLACEWDMSHRLVRAVLGGDQWTADRWRQLARVRAGLQALLDLPHVLLDEAEIERVEREIATAEPSRPLPANLAVA